MLLITLLLVLIGVIVLSYYGNREYFQNQPGTVGLGKNKSYGGLGVSDAQLGNNADVYDPITKLKKPYTQPYEPTTLQLAKNSIHPRPTIDSNHANYGQSGLHHIKGSMAAAADPQRNDVIPEVVVSDTSFSAMDLQNKSALLKDIQKIVKQELLMSRNQPINNPIEMGSLRKSRKNSEDCDGTDSTQQGTEFRSSKQDMSNYIRKDSIPCWGCSLDY